MSTTAPRTASRSRKTAETSVELEIDLDGSGEAVIDTGIPFFDHMLTLFAKHGLFDLRLKVVGDIAVDFHHTVEDSGIVLGDCLREALGGLDPDKLSPREALDALYRLRSLA